VFLLFWPLCLFLALFCLAMFCFWHLQTWGSCPNCFASYCNNHFGWF
jgi:hypothetical protein